MTTISFKMTKPMFLLLCCSHIWHASSSDGIFWHDRKPIRGSVILSYTAIYIRSMVYIYEIKYWYSWNSYQNTIRQHNINVHSLKNESLKILLYNSIYIISNHIHYMFLENNMEQRLAKLIFKSAVSFAYW